MMLAARNNTGARLLYSDEDKIDELGYLFTEPHLKTDWNYRLLLGQNNYVCHLLVCRRRRRCVRPDRCRRTVRRGTGSRFDPAPFRAIGSQREIHHVPEILYHWRKSAGSTASVQSAKSYAVEAGKQAVIDHLERRRGLRASVSAPHRFNSTLYEVDWSFAAEPKISILIPFKDQVEITQRCVECILEQDNLQEL